MSRPRFWACVAGLIVCGLFAAPALSAQDDQRARLHFESGASYYEAGEYADALREFQRAFELSHRPQLLYNISLCYQNLGDLAQAVSYLERYLNEVSNIENRANLEIRLRNLRERMAREASSRAGGGEGLAAGTGTGAQAGTPQGAGGETSGASGAGATSGTGAAEGEGPSALGGSADAGDRGTGAGTGLGTGTPTGSGDGGVNAGAIGGFSVAAVGLVLGGIFGGLTAAEDARLSGTPCGAARTCSDSELGDLRAFAAVADVGFGVALAGAVVGTIFLIVGGGSSPSTESEQASLDVVPVAGRDVAGLSVGGSF